MKIILALVLGLGFISICIHDYIKNKKLIEQNEKILAENQREKFLLNMTKVSCCDLCMEDHVSWRISAKEANEPVVIIHAGFRQFRLCEKHAKQLAETLSNGKADDYVEYIN